MKKIPRITIAIPVYNTTSTLKKCLSSIKKQTVLPVEIIFIDNKSKDGSIEMIKKFQKEEEYLPIILLTKNATTSVGASFNMALRKARGELFLTMHSDSILPTNREIEKLIAPLADSQVLATYSYVLHPRHIWDGYNLWEKCLSSRVVDTRIPAMNGKFDCYRVSVLKKMGGFDEFNFDVRGDALDADIFNRLNDIGKVVVSDAEVVHLHYLKNDFKLSEWILKRKNMGVIAGRLLKIYKNKINLTGIASFSLRPLLAILPFIPPFRGLGIMLLLAFSILYTPRMFTTKSTLTDPRIFTLPFINICLIYYESFWTLYMLITHKVQKVRAL